MPVAWDWCVLEDEKKEKDPKSCKSVCQQYAIWGY